MLPLLPLALTLAPSLLRAVAGDRGGDTAQAAAQVVQAVTGTDDPVQAEAALQDPATRIRALQGLSDLALEAEKVAAADRADARARDVALRQAGAHRRMPGVLLAIGGFGALLGVGGMIAATVLGLPEGGAVMGALIAVTMLFAGIVKDAAAFEWGSSFGSRAKDGLGPFGQGKEPRP